MNLNAQQCGAGPNRAVIDIGTNSARLLVYTVEGGGRIRRIGKWVRYTRMGQDLGKTGRLHPDAIRRNLDALAGFRTIAGEYAAADFYVFGTSALRDAANSGEFVALAREKTGLDVQVVPGTLEAEYGFLGVSQSFDEPVLIFDIGGGSTELIRGQGDRMEKMISLNTGCVRGTEAHIRHDPPQAGELEAIKADTRSLLAPVAADYIHGGDFRLVGIGGTATTLSTIHQHLAQYDSDKVNKSVVTRAGLEQMTRELSRITLEERRKTVGLEAKRADIIVAGACILEVVLEQTGCNAFTVCDYDNLEGAAYKKFRKTVDR